MKPPKIPLEFDYDLWKTEDGICMVRVKLTGEVCSVDEQTFRLLRNEEKRLRRFKAGITAPEHPSERGTLLSTDYISLDSSDDDIQASWLIDPVSMEDSLATQMLEDELKKPSPCVRKRCMDPYAPWNGSVCSLSTCAALRSSPND